MTPAKPRLERTPLFALLLFVLLAGSAQPLPAAGRESPAGAARCELVEHGAPAKHHAFPEPAELAAAPAACVALPRALPRWRDVSERGLAPPRAPDA